MIPVIRDYRTVILWAVSVLTIAGCGRDSAVVTGPDDKCPYAVYAPSDLDIMPLTGIEKSENDNSAEITVYLSLKDEFDTQMKAPCSIRFELFDKLYRTADPRGKRIKIWPEVNLEAPDANHQYWLEFLRAYKFTLAVKNYTGSALIIQATCIFPDGRRLNSDFDLSKTMSSGAE